MPGRLCLTEMVTGIFFFSSKIGRTNAKTWVHCVEMQHPFTNPSSWHQAFTETASADRPFWQLELSPRPPFLGPHMGAPTPFTTVRFFRLFWNLLYSKGWPWTSDPLSVLELRQRTTMLSSCLCFETPSVPWPENVSIQTDFPAVIRAAQGLEELPWDRSTACLRPLPPEPKGTLHADVVPTRLWRWGPSHCPFGLRALKAEQGAGTSQVDSRATQTWEQNVLCHLTPPYL